ncbi:unnamed protein product [Ectocarpus sp. 12 AP-2014]
MCGVMWAPSLALKIRKTAWLGLRAELGDRSIHTHSLVTRRDSVRSGYKRLERDGCCLNDYIHTCAPHACSVLFLWKSLDRSFGAVLQQRGQGVLQIFAQGSVQVQGVGAGFTCCAAVVWWSRARILPT